ncbi:MAG: ribbon-helix-helix domain-containing protein [Candidatus Bathyarchaeia archaeon]
MTKVKKELVNLNVKIPKNMAEAIQGLIKNELFTNTSEFVREAIRKQVQNIETKEA